VSVEKFMLDADGKRLLDADGKMAIHEDCCCGGECPTDCSLCCNTIGWTFSGVVDGNQVDVSNTTVLLAGCSWLGAAEAPFTGTAVVCDTYRWAYYLFVGSDRVVFYGAEDPGTAACPEDVTTWIYNAVDTTASVTGTPKLTVTCED